MFSIHPTILINQYSLCKLHYFMHHLLCILNIVWGRITNIFSCISSGSLSLSIYIWVKQKNLYSKGDSHPITQYKNSPSVQHDRKYMMLTLWCYFPMNVWKVSLAFINYNLVHYIMNMHIMCSVIQKPNSSMLEKSWHICAILFTYW